MSADIAKRLRGDACLDEQIISSLILIAELQIPGGRDPIRSS
jgi:hypothetical protein